MNRVWKLIDTFWLVLLSLKKKAYDTLNEFEGKKVGIDFIFKD